MKKTALLSICLGFTVAAFSACASPTETPELGCDYARYHCKEGQLWQCINGTETIASNCNGLGCDSFTHTCNTVTPSINCNYTGTLCKEDGKLYQCASGAESVVNDCGGLGCDITTNICNPPSVTPEPSEKCAYTEKICKNGQLYQCIAGTETIADTCNGLGCNTATNTCHTAQDTPDSDCPEDGYYCMDGHIYECADGVKDLVEDCGSFGCDEYGCLGTVECTEDMCTEDGRDLVKCVDGIGEIEPCLAGCINGACKDAACSATPTTCYDNKTRYECDGDGQLKTVPCPNGQGCVNNVCQDTTSDATCDFETSCTADYRGIRKCVNGTASYEACPDAQSCDDATGEPACVSAVVNGVCTALFNDYCEDNRWLHYCDDPDKAGPEKKDCGRGKCIGNRCVINSKTFGDECNPDTFDRTCIDNQIAYCDKGSKKVSREAEGNCAADGGICGITLDGGIPEVMCYEPCTVQGSMRNVCMISGEQTAQYQEECILVDSGIGDGRLGYSYVNDSLNYCDIGCSEGKCFDYTEGIPGIGQSCNPDTKAGFCQGDLAVTCDSDGEGNYVLQAEKCYVDETCAVETVDYKAPTAYCAEACTPGSVKTECGEPGTFGANIVFTYECIEQDGKYYYSSTASDWTSCDNERKTCQAGQCK